MRKEKKFRGGWRIPRFEEGRDIFEYVQEVEEQERRLNEGYNHLLDIGHEIVLMLSEKRSGRNNEHYKDCKPILLTKALGLQFERKVKQIATADELLNFEYAYEKMERQTLKLDEKHQVHPHEIIKYAHNAKSLKE
uniref:Phage protein n=1 Tax=Parastrongyloides trichosuri TaxID=131310 RepID=A0A0N5A6Y2_PARTI